MSMLLPQRKNTGVSVFWELWWTW